ncbi:MAG: metallophosphoesterase [Paludibacteraceae bacterium]
MTMYFFELIVLITIITACDYWFFRKMKKHRFYHWFAHLSLVPGMLFILLFFYTRFGFRYNHYYVVSTLLQWAFFIFGLVYIPKIIYILFYYLNNIYCKKRKVHSYLFRRIGYAVGIFSVLVMGYGNVITRDDVELVKKDIDVKQLPPAFDKYKIAIFADLHIGNWNNRYQMMERISQIIDKEEPDIIVFAGDMVNNFADELQGWKPYFASLKSKYGMFAILGNHDHGDYANWKSIDGKADNLKRIKKGIEELGFKLLLNEHYDLTLGKDTITLVGVENYSDDTDKPNYCDLKKALAKTNTNRKKILLTHDPKHWNAEVTGKDDIFLTISGHTHGGQIGIINKCIRFSPVMFSFKQWEGLYQQNNQYIYVNRGVGFVGIPMRIGVKPEVTVLTLKAAAPH